MSQLPTAKEMAEWTPHGDGRALTPAEFQTWNPHDGGHPYNPHCCCDTCTNMWRDREAERSHKLREICIAQEAKMTPEEKAEQAERIRLADAEWAAENAEREQAKVAAVRHELLVALLSNLHKQLKDKLPTEDIIGMAEGYLEEIRDVGYPKVLRTMDDRLNDYTGLRPYVIENLLRQGETMNFVSETKVGKSWLAYALAICKAAGQPFLGRFAMDAGQVLYIDNELHEQTTDFRFLEVSKALGIERATWARNVTAENLRGKLKDISRLGSVFAGFKPGDLSLVIIDAGYRALPKDADENKNGDMTDFYNQIDAHAMRLNCAFINVMHSTKGSQGQKRITDVGAGAGSQSRATDSHVVLRAHQQDDVFVFDFALRSSPKLHAFCARWNWPLWTVDDSLDPADLRTDRPRKPAKVDVDGIVKQEPWSGKRFAAEFCTPQPIAKAVLIDRAIAAGVSERTASRLIASAEADGLIHQWPGKRIAFATVKPPELPLDAATATDSPATATKKARVVAAIEDDPEASDQTIAEACDCSRSFVQKTRNSLS